MTLVPNIPSRWILQQHATTFLSLLLISNPCQAQSPGPPPEQYGQSFNPSMGVVIIVLIAALFFMGFFSIYIRHCSQDTSTSGTATRRALNGSVARSRRAPRGLDRTLIDSFPTFEYSSVKELKIGKGALECAVCLNEFEDDDTIRLIPKCDHVFHPECIDAWLMAHTTCPVCRSDLVQPDPELGVPLPNATATNDNDVVSEREGRESSHDNGDEEERVETESMEMPLQGRAMNRSRSMRRNMSFGRPRSWLGSLRFARSFSTGHVAVKQWENMERFTLRLPEDVRKQLVSGKLERSTSLVVLPRETSSRRGYRTGFGEGSGRGGRPAFARSDRWVFSLAPPFVSRVPSVRSPKVAASRDGTLHGPVPAGSIRLPV